MSSSAAERQKTPETQNTAATPWQAVRGIALAAGAAALPATVAAWVSGNALMVSVSALAAAASVSAYAFATLAHMRGNQAETALQADAFGHLVEHMRDAVFQFNAAGELTLASRSSGDLFGCQKYELAGAGLSERTHVLDRPLYMTAFADARHHGNERLIEVRMRRDRDEPGQVAPEFVWVEVNFSPIRHAAEERGPFGVIALMRDISTRKQTEKRIVDAQKAAEEASLAKSQFLAVIGHELRTPLNAIVGFSDMMSSGIGGTLTETHSEYAGLISQSGHHLLDVVNMLLDMSRIEAGKFELHAAKFEPEALVGPCIRIVSKAAQEKNVEVEVELGKNLPEIIGDERACRQILINLLSNAIKFSESGGRVTWSMKRLGQSLSITIADQGIGMNADVLARLGEPFFQAQSTAQRRYEGTGLGMSIVKGLVDLHDGTLKVSSEPGRGTSVTIVLPVNGPETRIDDDGGITKLHPETNTAHSEQWSEPKRMAK